MFPIQYQFSYLTRLLLQQLQLYSPRLRENRFQEWLGFIPTNIDIKGHGAE
jgi:hypothetical protein